MNVKHTFIYFALNIASACVPFFLLPVMIIFLTPEDLGRLAVFQSYLIFFTVFSGMSAHLYFSRVFFDSKSDFELSKVISSALLTVLIIFSLILFISLLYKIFFNPLLLSENGLILALMISTCVAVIQIKLAEYQVKGLIKKYAFLQGSFALLNIIFSYFLIVNLLKVEARFLGYFISAFIILIYCLYDYYRDDRYVRVFIPDVKNLLLFGVPLIPHLLGLFLLNGVDKYIVSNLSGDKSAGIFLLALQISLVVTMVFEAVNKVYMPSLFKKLQLNCSKVNRKLVLETYFIFATVITTALIVGYFSHYILKIILPVQYLDSADLVPWLILGQTFSGLYYIFSNYIYFSKRTKFLSFASLISGFLYSILIYVTILKFGFSYIGPAFVLAMFCRFIIAWYISNYVHPMPWLLKLNKFY